jgi:predicted phosphate transport protein (TIGR00153 family)
MAISLVPQKREFFVLYTRASANVVEIARHLVELVDNFPDGGEDRFRGIRELEHEGDRITRELIALLNRTFVTPFDRDDMFRLTRALDDICDYIDEAAGDLVSYGAQRVRDIAREQAQVIQRAATKLHEAVERLEGFKDSERQLAELRELEDEGDRLVREGVARLFAESADDPIAVIRWKDIHERLEEAVDSCEHAADVLEAILVKNR